MKKIFNILFTFSCFWNIHAQSDHSIDISLGTIREENYNYYMPILVWTGRIPVIDNRYAGFFALNYSYKSKSHFSPILSIKLVSRKINYIYLLPLLKLIKFENQKVSKYF